MMVGEVPVSEARRKLSGLLTRVQEGKRIRITRRGKPVAVLLSLPDYLALTGERPSFMDATRGVRERFDVDALGSEDQDFEGLRAGPSEPGERR